MATRTTKPLNRAQLREALQSVPDSDIYGARVARELTPKQKKFARALAEGKTKADAYREAYRPDVSQRTLNVQPYMLARDERITKEREAIERAMEAARHRTPAALRELVIQSLVEVITDQDAAPAVRVSAARVLGTVTEVAAFTERKEVRTITSSEDARRKVLGQLRELMNSTATDATDATIVDTQADALLAELRSAESANPDPHPPGTPHDAQRDSDADTHTIPSERSADSAGVENFPPADPTPSAQETPPGDGT